MEFKLPEYFSKNFDKINEDVIVYIFQESEKRLIETSKIFDSATSKAYKILSILIALTTLAFGVILTIIKENDTGNILLIPSVICLCAFIVCYFFLIKVIWTYDVFVIGTDPQDMLDIEFFSDLEFEVQKKNLVLNQIVDYQTRITKNRIVNERRLKMMDYTIKILIFLPGSFLIPLLIRLWPWG